MESDRFDSLTRSLAAPASRRRALRLFGAGGLLAALGAERIDAATKACSLTIRATTATGTHKDQTYAGTLTLQIGDQGAIDHGRFDLDDGSSLALVGQAAGRALNLRIILADQTVLALDGTAEIDLILCRGAVSGVFGGPDDTDLGTWRTVAGTGNAGNGASGDANGSTSGGAVTGGVPDAPGGGGGGNGCASGVVCGGTCCVPADGTTPDRISCAGASCACAYSCQAAGCPNGGTDHSFSVGCGDKPAALCGEHCNFPANNGCPGVACPAGQSLDLATCTCVLAGGQNGGGDAGAACPGTTNCGTAANPVCAETLTDPNHCGGCEVKCAPGQECSGGACTSPCPQPGARHCSGVCVDVTSDTGNCGGCGVLCATGQLCQAGACVACGAGLTLCNGACVDLQTDAGNCGACGSHCAGDPCVGGFCCLTKVGFAVCNGACLDISQDSNNCGGCDKVCAPGTTCFAGACCPPKQFFCPGVGCLDLRNDANNCGVCGNVCPAGQSCRDAGCG